MITTKQVYYTSDNMAFGSLQDAEAHERGTVKEWIASDPHVNLSFVLDSFDDVEDDEYYCTEKDLATRFVTRAFELWQEGKLKYPDGS